MKFLKTIQFDASDTHVFNSAAGQDEWAIGGGFLFSGASEGELKGKAKQAFSHGFLSIESFGHSTFVSVAEVSEEMLVKIENELPYRFHQTLGAPNIEVANQTSEDEVKFVLDLCQDVPINSVFATSRYFDDAGEIKEEYRLVPMPGEKLHNRIWDVVED